MAATDGVRSPPPDGEDVSARPTGRIRGALAGTRALIRIAYRDPEHVAERLTLYASQRLGDPSRVWAEETRQARPDTPQAKLVEEQRTQSAKVARVDGAVAGTPFFIALVPGYMAYLWEEARMGLRAAALYGRDPAALRTAAELLALRGVHPTPDAAEKALVAVRDTPMPDKPTERRSLHTWIHSTYLLLVFGGFIDAPNNDAEQPEAGPSRLRAAAGMAIFGAIWVTTWVLPLSFMIVMAWGCETHTRELGRRVLIFYEGDAATADAAIAAANQHQDKGHDVRTILRTVALALSILVPIGFIAYADAVSQSGINWVVALGALAALSLVIAVTVMASRK